MTGKTAFRSPWTAAVLLGIGLGGFFDGIVLHQLLQWHHLVSSAGYPPDSVENLKLNTLLDGLFHAATYVLLSGPANKHPANPNKAGPRKSTGFLRV